MQKSKKSKNIKKRTDPESELTPSGQQNSIIIAEREQIINMIKEMKVDEYSADLINIIKAWDQLPATVKKGINAMIAALI